MRLSMPGRGSRLGEQLTQLPPARHPAVILYGSCLGGPSGESIVECPATSKSANGVYGCNPRRNFVSTRKSAPIPVSHTPNAVRTPQAGTAPTRRNKNGKKFHVVMWV